MQGILSNEEIEKAFSPYSFGTRNHRKLLQQGCLKRLAGYYCGHSLTSIMVELGLVGNNRKSVLKKGKNLMFEAFYDDKNQG